ncbi:MAG: bifunctional hydroxymethylpyrimidine kinase/phosphomethylpyrimidine kinase [Gemmatimonadaceae bacterium]
MQPTVLTIAGSDPSGGAGIQADLRTFAKTGVHGSAAITALTVQTRKTVSAVNLVSPEVVASQIDAAYSDGEVHAVKTGMLGQAAIVRAVITTLMRHGARNVVVDPVAVSSSGTRLLDEAGFEILKRELLPNATVVTPNLAEAAALLGIAAPTSLDEMRDAARKLCELGAKWVVVTGGHLGTGSECVDVVTNGTETHEIRTPRVANAAIHGSGCRYSAALAAALARGADVPTAAFEAQRFVAMEIRESSADRPALGRLYLVATPRAHMNGFELLSRIRAAVDGGVDVLQIRSKELDGGAYARLAERVGAIAAAANIPFIVNDRVDVAIAVNATGVHLGQKDLAVDLARRIMPYGILGRSSHEAAHALKAMEERADYFAVGPVWETPTKPGRKAAGVKYVREVAALKPDIPWYAIGGIDTENVREVVEAGARRIAVVRAILDARDPAAAANALKAALDGAPSISNAGVA